MVRRTPFICFNSAVTFDETFHQHTIAYVRLDTAPSCQFGALAYITWITTASDTSWRSMFVPLRYQ